MAELETTWSYDDVLRASAKSQMLYYYNKEIEKIEKQKREKRENK